MSKKAILSALLVSSALLGATAANAATSDIKAESKKVTVSTEKAKLYKDSKLKESTTPKNGTVYQVDGYRNINGKHVYRVYQTDKNGKKAYRGYIDSKDTKDLKADKAKGQFVLNGKANVWKNFYWTAKNTDNAERVVFAKYEYTLGNGQKYYSVYSKDAAGKEVWQGYTSKSNLKEVTSTKESKYVALKKDTKSFANLYFQQTKGNFDVKSGVNFKVTRYYTIDGKKYYSTERAGKTWTGYVDSSVVEDLKAEKVAAADSNVKVAKDWNTYSDHFYTKKAKLADYKGKNLTAKYVYTYGNGKKYASLYDGDTWVGYANVQALASNADEETRKAIDAANDAIKKAEDILSKAQASKESKEAAQKVIDAAKETVKKGNLEDIKKVPAQIAEAIKGLKPGATTIDIQRVEEAIEAGKEAIKEAEAQGVGSIDKANIEKVNKAIEAAQKVIADMKKGDASTEDADKAIKDINDAVNGLKLPATTVDIEKLQQAIKEGTAVSNRVIGNVVSGREELNKAIEDAKKVLADAKAGKANGQDVADAIKAIEDAIDNVKLNKADLIKQVQEVQKLASNVYMTEKGEKEFVKSMTDIMNLPDKAVNIREFEDAKMTLNKAKKGLENQPNKVDGEALNKAIKQADALKVGSSTEAKTPAEKALKEAYDKANGLMTEMKKVTDKSNTATKEITKAEVEKATKDLNDAYDAYTKQADSSVKAAAKKAIEEADKKLNGPQVFDKAQEKAVKDAQSALAGVLLDSKSDVASIKAATDKLNKAIEAMKTVVFDLADWEHTDTDKTITLTKHKDVVAAKAKGQKPTTTTADPKVITIPGEVEGKQVIVTTNKANYPAYAQGFWSGVKDLTSVTFEQRNGKKVQGGDSLSRLFWAQTAIKSVDFTNLDTTNTKDMSSMFDGATALTTINFADMNTANVTNMANMFHKASALTSLDLTSFNTANVTSMSNMFALATKLEEVKLGQNFKTDKVTTMYGMFYQDAALKAIDTTNWNVSNVKQMSGMFEGCKALAGVDMTNWVLPAAVASKQDATTSVEDATKKVATNLKDMFKQCTAFTKDNVKLPTNTNTKAAIVAELKTDIPTSEKA